MPVEQLVRRFEPEQPEQPPPVAVARSLVEYCSYVALRAETRRRHDHLADRDFHSLTYDMMLAWEAPDQETEAEFQVCVCLLTDIDLMSRCSLRFSH